MSVRQGRLAFAPEYDVLQAGAGQVVVPAAVADDWSDAFTAVAGTLDTGAVQAILMPTGKILVTTRAVAYTMTPPALGQPIPANLTVTPQIVPREFPTPVTGNGVTVIDTAFCNGGTLLADGTVLLAGGTRHIFSGATMYQLGLAQSVRYTRSSWQALPDMKGRGAYPEPTRWYPTATRLASGKVLVTGGYDTVSWGTKNLSAEVYDPGTNDWTVVTPTNGLPPEMFSWQYTHQFQLPFVTPGGEDVLGFGDAGVPGYMNASGSWRLSTKIRAGSLGVGGLQPNTGTTSLLPLRVNNGEWGCNNGSVIMAGGQTSSTQMNRIDVYDPKTDQWKFPRSMGVSRAHAASVVLPDARILVMGGRRLRDECWAGSHPVCGSSHQLLGRVGHRRGSRGAGLPQCGLIAAGRPGAVRQWQSQLHSWRFDRLPYLLAVVHVSATARNPARAADPGLRQLQLGDLRRSCSSAWGPTPTRSTRVSVPSSCPSLSAAPPASSTTRCMAPNRCTGSAPRLLHDVSVGRESRALGGEDHQGSVALPGTNATPYPPSAPLPRVYEPRVEGELSGLYRWAACSVARLGLAASG